MFQGWSHFLNLTVRVRVLFWKDKNHPSIRSVFFPFDCSPLTRGPTLISSPFTLGSGVCLAYVTNWKIRLPTSSSACEKIWKQVFHGRFVPEARINEYKDNVQYVHLLRKEDEESLIRRPSRRWYDHFRNLIPFFYGDRYIGWVDGRPAGCPLLAYRSILLSVRHLDPAYNATIYTDRVKISGSQAIFAVS